MTCVVVIGHRAGMAIDFGTFFLDTVAFFRPAALPDRRPDVTSRSGSRYWDLEDAVIRESDHWGPDIRSCAWFYGARRHGMRSGLLRIGRCAYRDFARQTPATRADIMRRLERAERRRLLARIRADARLRADLADLWSLGGAVPLSEWTIGSGVQRRRRAAPPGAEIVHAKALLKRKPDFTPKAAYGRALDIIARQPFPKRILIAVTRPPLDA